MPASRNTISSLGCPTLGSLLILLPLGTGCASPHRDARSPNAHTALAGATHRERLARLAEQEVNQPHAGLSEWPAAPGLDSVLLTPRGDDRAIRSLEDVLVVVRGSGPQRLGSVRPASPEDRLSAQKLYVRARQKLLARQVAEGLRELEEATRLDPGSPDLAEQAAMLFRGAGRVNAGATHLRRAVMLGSQSPRVLLELAREESRAGRSDSSLSLYARTLDQSRAQSQEALVFLASAEFAEQLANAGYTQAARTQLEEHLRLVADGLELRNREYGHEVVDTTRRSASLLVLLGDLASQMDDPEGARAAYAQAVVARPVDETTSLARLLTAQMRTGRPAQAAITLLEDVERRQGRITPWHADAAKYLLGSESLAPTLPGAIVELVDQLRPVATHASRQDLALLAASTAGPSVGLTLLELALRDDPGSSRLLASFADRVATLTHKDALLALRRVVEHDPMQCEAVAQAVLESGRRVAVTIETLRASKDPLDNLLLASMLRRLGLFEESLERASLARQAYPQPATLSRIASLAALGRSDEAAADVASLRADSTEDARVYAAALDLCERTPEAWAALVSNLDEFRTQADIETLYFACDLAMRLGRHADAATILESIAARQPDDSRALEGLISLSLPNGLLPDEQRLTSAILMLRRAAPSSKTIQWLLAQESLQRGLIAQAQSQLKSLVASDADPPAAVDLLVRSWEQDASIAAREVGTTWLRERLHDRPESTTWLLALTRMLVRQDRADEALALLRERIAVFPIEPLMLQEEYVVRVGLEQPDEADRLAVARLRRSAQSPERALALAEVLVRMQQPGEALVALRPVLTPGRQLTPASQRAIVALFEQLSDPTILTSPEAIESALQLCVLIEEFHPSLPIAMRLRKLELMAMSPSRTGEELLGQVDRIVAIEPAAQSAAFGRVFLPLMNNPEPRRLLRFLGAAAVRDDPMSESLAYEWLIRTAAQGSIEDGAWLLEQVSSTARAQRVLRRVGSRRTSTTLPLLQADIAHALGNFASMFGRHGLAKWAFRSALTSDPSHALAANNLGFFILEYGGDLDEARALITRAHEAEPNDASILDSMGWLMYKLGQIDDRVDESGRIVHGAVWYIEAAAQDPDGSMNDEVLHHLGDALWRRSREGDRTKAQRAWQLSEAILRESLESLPQQPKDDQTLAAAQRRVQLAGIQKNLATLQAKIVAAQQGMEPTLAPMSIPSASSAGDDAPILTPMPPPRVESTRP